MITLLALGMMLFMPGFAPLFAALALANALRHGLPLWERRIAAQRWDERRPMLVKPEGLEILQGTIWRLVRWCEVASVRRCFLPDLFAFEDRQGATLFTIDPVIPDEAQMAMALAAAARDGHVPEEGIFERIPLGASEPWVAMLFLGKGLGVTAALFAAVYTLPMARGKGWGYAALVSAGCAALALAIPFIIHRRRAIVMLRT